jgi:uncharacterized protein YceH (UPF0502 family)
MSDTAIFENSDHAAAEPVPPLSAIEARILGSLIEKAAITPDIYPLTVNAVVQACNQKTSREPIMHLDTGEIGHALREMEAKGLVKLDPFAQRAARYTHCLDAVYGVMPRQRALLCVMLLRGPQTLSELHTRCERLADFPALDDVRGQREDRYMHLLCGPVDVDAYAAAAAIHSPSSGASSELVDRVAKLEEEVAALKAQLETLIGP